MSEEVWIGTTGPCLLTFRRKTTMPATPAQED